MATGGGGPIPDADVDPDISEIAPALLVEIPDALDSDFIENHITQITSPAHEECDDIINMPSTATTSSTTTSTTTCTVTSTTTSPTTTSPTTRPSILPFAASAGRTDRTDSNIQYSDNEKRLRVQILKEEHKKREIRANALHKIEKKHQEEKNSLEIQILKQKLIEATAKAESAQREVHN